MAIIRGESLPGSSMRALLGAMSAAGRGFSRSEATQISQAYMSGVEIVIFHHYDTVLSMRKDVPVLYTHESCSES